MEISGMSEIVDGCRYLSYKKDGCTDAHNVVHYNEAGVAKKVASTVSTEYYTRQKIRNEKKWKMYFEAIAEQEAEDKKNTSSRKKKTETEPKKLDDEEGEYEKEEEYDYESFGEEEDPEYEARKSSNYKKIKDRDAIK